VERRAWLDEAAFAEIVGLCQFLPGPTSSQVAYCLGLRRAGLAGGLAAWAAFTAPSALLMFAFAYGAAPLIGGAVGDGLIHGLKLAAVAIVAQAVWSMARSLCPDRPRAAIAGLALLGLVVIPGPFSQAAVLLAGALAGLWLCGQPAAAPGLKGDPGLVLPRGVGPVCLVLAFGLLAVGAVGPTPAWSQLFHAFYRAGALVFGGGHVVLPMLRDSLVRPGWVGAGSFLATYGAAQALPGPLFSIAAGLGAISRQGPGGAAGAAIALAGISMPGLLLVTGVAGVWTHINRLPRARAAMAGVNAAVVGVLAGALYNPVWTGAVFSPLDFALAAAAFVLLTVWRAPPLIVVLACALGGAMIALA